MVDGPEVSFQEKLLRERRELVNFSAMRLWGPLAWLALVVAMRLGYATPTWRGLLPVALVYSAYSVALTIVRRSSPRRSLPYATALVDVPAAGVIGLVWAHAAPQSTDWACGVATAMCVTFIALGALLLNLRVVAAGTATSVAVLVSLFVHLHQPWDRILLALILVGLASGAGRLLTRATLKLMQRSWDLAEARVRDVEERNREIGQLNEELVHQIAERSRQLTEILAQLDATVKPVAVEIGSVFDRRYRVMSELGAGGMGTVYRVERLRDGKHFALKVVTSAVTGRQAARFTQEAEIGARVRHENVVSIVDVGVAAGAAPFLVMELVAGGSLEEHRARFGDVAWAMPILRQIATGLAELHDRGIVHRDLKPGNVLLAETDAGVVVKISDFGISRFGVFDIGNVDEMGATLDATRKATGLTETGAWVGTPMYMPPEARSQSVRDPSADMFSFGLLAYETLSGRAPFSAPPVFLAQSGKGLPEPAALDGVSAAAHAMLLACLRIESSERPHAKDALEALS